MSLLHPGFQPDLHTFTAPGIGLLNGPIRRAVVPLFCRLDPCQASPQEGMTPRADLNQRLMENQEVREEDAKADAEFALIDAMITARREAN